MITVQKVSKVLHSWLMIALMLFLSFSAWDHVFPDRGTLDLPRTLRWQT